MDSGVSVVVALVSSGEDDVCRRWAKPKTALIQYIKNAVVLQYFTPSNVYRISLTL